MQYRPPEPMAVSAREKRLAPRVYAYRRDESQKMFHFDWWGPQLQQEVKLREAQTSATRHSTNWTVQPKPHSGFLSLIMLQRGERYRAASSSLASDLPARPEVWYMSA